MVSFLLFKNMGTASLTIAQQGRRKDFRSGPAVIGTRAQFNFFLNLHCIKTAKIAYINANCWKIWKTDAICNMRAR